MLNDFPTTHRTEKDRLRYTEPVGLVVQPMNPSSYPFTEIDSSAHLDNNSSNTLNSVSNSNNSTSSSSNSEQQVEQNNLLHHQEAFNNISNNLHSHSHHQLNSQHHHHQQKQQQYFATEQDSNYNNSIQTNRSNSSTSSSSPNGSALNVNSEINNSSSSNIKIESMNVDTSHKNMIPTAHGSDHQVHYSLPTHNHKNLGPESSPSSMALNFSHDPLQGGHHNQGASNMHAGHHSSGDDTKNNQITSSFELDSASLMQTATSVSMNMWKNTMGLNHFKHPAIADHNFLPSSEHLNSFSSWTHNVGGNLGNHQAPNMPHHILESQHLIGYSQHQRSLPISNQDLVGVTNSIKGNHSSHAEQATSFMLNSINHQATSSQNSSSNHQTNQLENLNLRSNHLDHNASYNLSMNDNQIYTSSRSEGRSHPNAINIKPSFVVPDRSMHMSLTNHHSQLTYHSAEHVSIQPTTSHQVASSSSGSTSSKTEWRCSYCSEVFPLRTVYQAHLKTHSQEKGNNLLFINM